MINSMFHAGIKLACFQSDAKFSNQLDSLEAVQRQKLASVLASSVVEGDTPTDYASFAASVPLVRYKDLKPRIEAARSGGTRMSTSPIVRYQPTSGSSESIKFIPYTKTFLDELDSAIAPWLMSMYRQHKGLAHGKHYWSVSWLPESQREVLAGENLNDDSALLGLGKRILSKFTQTVPSDVAFASEAEDALFATVCYLVADKHLSMISVWSPTFALQLIEMIEAEHERICQVLETGNWGSVDVPSKAPHAPARSALLKQLIAEPGELNLGLLWPKLSLVSAWATAGAKSWAMQLQNRIPGTGFEGKGLWATEGVVTIPYNNRYPLAYQSHFYEFENLDTGEVLPSWKLELGMNVSPIISSGNGLLRYCMDDHIQVTGFMGKVPCFEFVGRRFGVDLVGEKLDPSVAQSVMATVGSEYGLKPVSMLAIDTQATAKPYYLALFEGDQTQVDPKKIDTLLNGHFHYELARNLGQLDEPKVLIADDGWATYKLLATRDGMIEGNIKPEVLKKIGLEALSALS